MNIDDIDINLLISELSTITGYATWDKISKALKNQKCKAKPRKIKDILISLGLATENGNGTKWTEKGVKYVKECKNEYKS